MCNIFASQDPSRYACETRALRLHGHCTSIRLEVAFWQVLERLAEQEGTSVARFCAALHDEVLALRGEVGNFASLLRVTCRRWLEARDGHMRELASRAA